MILVLEEFKLKFILCCLHIILNKTIAKYYNCTFFLLFNYQSFFWNEKSNLLLSYSLIHLCPKRDLNVDVKTTLS